MSFSPSNQSQISKSIFTILHLERPKLNKILAFLSAIGLKDKCSSLRLFCKGETPFYNLRNMVLQKNIVHKYGFDNCYLWAICRSLNVEFSDGNNIPGPEGIKVLSC